jgi:hypothetical protein
LVGGPPDVELHTVVDELPSADTGDMIPIVLLTIDVAMVPNGVAGIIAVDDIVVVDGVGTGAAVMAGGGGDGAAGGGGAGTVEPGNVDRNDVAGCADSVSIGAVVLFADVEEVAGADIVVTAETDGIVPIVPPSADMEITGTAAVPGASCPVGVEQVTTVPGVVGLDARGTGANVVSGVPG